MCRVIVHCQSANMDQQNIIVVSDDEDQWDINGKL